jgi:hypothetical protein
MHTTMSAILRRHRPAWALMALLSGTFFGHATAYAQNVAPTITGQPPGSAVVGKVYDFRPTAYDANGNVLRFGVANAPRWASFDKRTGRLYGKPSMREIGRTRAITVKVSDGKLSASLPAFQIAVLAASAISIQGTPASTAHEGELYSFLPTTGNPYGSVLTFSIANKPGWATFSSSTGLLSGIPPVGTAGAYTRIQLSVSDGQGSRSLPAFSIVVGAAAKPPTISGSPKTTAPVGQPYAFRPTASDPDGHALRFAIAGKPTWAAFDATSGALSGTPSAAGTSPNVIISVTDGNASAMLPPFTLTAAVVNTSPTISGVASGTATVGQLYSFAPSVTDPDNQVMTFTVANRPSWASFDTATGRLSGTPVAANVGTYGSIVIAVSDGQASSALGALTVIVKAAAVTGSATLSWVPPTQNVDGSPITNLAGFKVNYGQSATNLDRTVVIPSPAISSTTIEQLAAGTWYFAVKAYTAANVESDLSNLAQKTIN